MAPVDRFLYRRSGGRLTILGLQGRAMPETCLLTTTGRRSGKPRTTPVMFLREGGSIVVTSESFGQVRPAAWPLNLTANPAAAVRIGSELLDCRARPASEDEIERLWPRFTALWPAHASYRERSGVLKMFVLEPVRGSRPASARAGLVTRMPGSTGATRAGAAATRRARA